jgi:hypothetical protein
MFNPLEYSILTSQETRCVSITKPSVLMMFKEIILVHSENHTEQINAACGGKLRNFWTLKQVVHSVVYRPVAKRWLCKQRTLLGNARHMHTTIEQCFLCCSFLRCYKQGTRLDPVIPCGGGVEYLHRTPASSRTRRKGKSRIWDTKIWSLVPRHSDSRMTALARTSSNCKRQTRPLVSWSPPHQQNSKCLTVIKFWS